MQSELDKRQEQIDSLKDLLKQTQMFSKESKQISPEIKVLFPAIKDIALAQTLASNVNTSRTDTVNVIFVRTSGFIPQKERGRLTNFVGVRLKEDNLRLVVNPPSFPWPSSE